ncbi:MAG TPA: helix-turn-helix domain-containing protein [Sphingomicrobium sp.]
MNAQTIAVHFADALNRERSLTEQETAMLMQVVHNTERAKRSWTIADTRKLRRLIAKGCTRREIAQTMGRSCFTIDKRVRRIKERARG